MTEDGEPEGSGTDDNDGTDQASVERADATDESDSDGELDIPLPWNTVRTDDGDSAAEPGDEASDGPDSDTAESDTKPDAEAFEDLRFVGPKTAPLLRASDVAIADITEKRVSYRDLTDAGVNPGVAAKIRREHSLSWSLDGGGTDLDRRSDQIRGLDDDERAWIAESSGWSADAETATDGDNATAETDDSGDDAAGETAWRARTNGGDGTRADEGASAPATAGEADWWAESGASGSAASGAETADARDAGRDAESAWQRESAPTPLTAVEGFDDEVATTLRKAGIGSVRRLATADPESVADALELDAERVRAWRERAREHAPSTTEG